MSDKKEKNEKKEKKWNLKRIMLWCVIALVAANSFWTIMQSRIVATASEVDAKFGVMSARVAELEKGSSAELEDRVSALEKKIEALISGLESRAKIEEARRKALSDQIKVLEEELKQLEER